MRWRYRRFMRRPKVTDPKEIERLHLLKLTRTTWYGMRRRCTVESDLSYRNYGARGIKVCPRWLKSFDAFVADMGIKPSRDHTIERKDVNGNYEPSNCIWITKAQQAWNKTNTVRVRFRGQLWSLAQLCDALDIKHALMAQRIGRNIPVEMALNMPRTYTEVPVMDAMLGAPLTRIAPKELIPDIDPETLIGDLCDTIPDLKPHALY